MQLKGKHTQEEFYIELRPGKANLKAYQTNICMPGKQWKEAMKEYQHRWEGDSWLAGNHAEWQLSSVSTPDLASEPKGCAAAKSAGPLGRCGSAPGSVSRKSWCLGACHSASRVSKHTTLRTHYWTHWCLTRRELYFYLGETSEKKEVPIIAMKTFTCLWSMLLTRFNYFK